MGFLTQTRFPGLWRVFQHWIGGTVDKRALCTLKFDGQSSVLEVGCSLGNISRVFVQYKRIQYTGIDVDPVVIEYARKSFSAQKNFTFICEDLSRLPKTRAGFGYVLFAGILHHLPDDKCREILAAARNHIEFDGRLVAVEPLIPRSDDPWFLSQFMKLEQGEHLRTGPELRALLDSVPGFRFMDAEEHLIGCSPFHRPICARFGVYTLLPT